MAPESSARVWLDALPDAIVCLDGEGTLVWANQVAVDLFGVALEDHLGRSGLDLLHPDDQRFAALSLVSVQTKSIGTPIELRIRTATGWRLVECVGASHIGRPGMDCIVFSLRDLTERRRWEVGRGDDALFRAVVHNAGALLMLIERDGTIRSASGAAARMLGLDQEALEGRAMAELVSAEDRPTLAGALRACHRGDGGGEGTVKVEVGLSGTDGGAIPFELTLVDLIDDPTVSGVVVSGHDISQLRAARDALADLAQKDPLTRVWNRAALDARLALVLSDSATVTVAFVDLDGLKALNDHHGHRAGDRVLRVTAERLTAAVRTGDLVARYGGDEFVVVTQLADVDRGQLTARLESALCDPLALDDRTVAVSASVGVATSLPGDRPADLLERADQAMYQRKATDGRTGRLFPLAIGSTQGGGQFGGSVLAESVVDLAQFGPTESARPIEEPAPVNRGDLGHVDNTGPTESREALLESDIAAPVSQVEV